MQLLVSTYCLICILFFYYLCLCVYPGTVGFFVILDMYVKKGGDTSALVLTAMFPLLGLLLLFGVTKKRFVAFTDKRYWSFFLCFS